MRLLLVSMALGLVASAVAQNVTYTGFDEGVTNDGFNYNGFTVGNDKGDVLAGQIDVTVQGSSGYVPTYCVTPYLNLDQTSGSYWSVNTGILLTDPSVSFYGYTTAVQNEVAYLASQSVTGYEQAAEVQVAIWDAELPISAQVGLSSYALADSSFATAVTGYDTAADGYANKSTAFTLLTPVLNGKPDGISQGLIVAGGATTPFTQTTPEPITTFLGIAGVGLFIRRRLKPARA